MNITRLHGLGVLVLGLGASGLAMARWCARQGANVRVWDTREAPPQAEALGSLVPAAIRLRGELTADALDGIGLVLKSPGLSPHDARLAALLSEATRRGIAVQGELELFAEALAALAIERGYAPKVVAITGTNGKTTTTAMTALLVERAGRSVAVAGNIGPTMLQTLSDRLGDEVVAAVQVDQVSASPATPVEALAITVESSTAPALPDVWVLELSSFQLDRVTGFEPDAAALLNITQDHLDWHGGIDDYAAAKARVFGTRALLVVNRDDAAVEALLTAALSAPPTKRGKVRPIAREVVRFGVHAPTAPGDYGIVTEHGMGWLVRARDVETDGLRKPRAGEIAPELQLQRLMPVDALQVRGRHNATNALAALALGSAIGCALAPMLHALRDYRGEPHRVQFIASVDGVDVFDDSKGTNVGATVAALDGLGNDRAPSKLVVVLGGDGKGQDFAPLATPLARHARAVATIGRDADAIERAVGPALEAAGIAVVRHATLEAATQWCFGQARDGDAVLLSPACASFDMFRDYAHRAAVFGAAVFAESAAHATNDVGAATVERQGATVTAVVAATAAASDPDETRNADAAEASA